MSDSKSFPLSSPCRPAAQTQMQMTGVCTSRCSAHKSCSNICISASDSCFQHEGSRSLNSERWRGPGSWTDSRAPTNSWSDDRWCTASVWVYSNSWMFGQNSGSWELLLNSERWRIIYRKVFLRIFDMILIQNSWITFMLFYEKIKQSILHYP